MTTEQVLVATAVAAWKINIERADPLFANLTDDQLDLEIAPGRNRLGYVLGHLAAVHDAMLPLLGIGEQGHPQLYQTYVKSEDRAEGAGRRRSAADLRRIWNEVNGRLQAAFDSYSPEDWVARHTAVSEADFAANPLRNRLAVLLSRTAHLSYHLGQVVLAQK